MPKIGACYTSAGCNRCPFSADWGRNGIICFAYNHAVAVYKPEGFSFSAGIEKTYIGHTDKVNCVKWINNGIQDEFEIVSGSTDSTINVWQYRQDSAASEPICTLKGHTGSVTCLSALYLDMENDSESRETLIVSASIDSTVRIWSRKSLETKENQVLIFGSGFALSLSTFIIPGTRVPLLVCGCDDHNIHLYLRGSDLQFTQLIVLTGHEDWIRDLQFVADDFGNILLASCAQDHLIRIWKLSRKSETQTVIQDSKPVSELKEDECITVKETIISHHDADGAFIFAITLESVLCGHENWVYSVRWQPVQVLENGSSHQPMKLLSASMDKTMILWAPDADTEMWMEQVRVGDVGGNTLGFFGGLFSPCGLSILAHGYQGAFNQWSFNSATKMWVPQVTGGGHFGSVVDIAWSAEGGDFLLSASADQTLRLHAPWVRKTHEPTWFEIARPQIHGYDLQCLAVLDKYSFASGADEKLVRVFKAPRNFINNFCHICGHDVNNELQRLGCASLPEGANVSALGLSNKAVYTDNDKSEQVIEEQNSKSGQYPENYFIPIDLKAPPSEDLLLQNTLWPEVAKLYGHGYEIFSLAASPDGKLLASACKAAKAESANILVWNMDTKKIMMSLSGCTLTVTQMAFSHDGNRLLAVSRDRSWTLYKKSGDHFVIESSVDKKTTPHLRIIWSCCWTHDDQFFITAARDKKVMLWSTKDVVSKLPPTPLSTLTVTESATAVAAAPCLVLNTRYLIAVGMENGVILIYNWSQNTDTVQNSENGWTLVTSLDQSQAHHLNVNRLVFRPKKGCLGYKENHSDWLQLASCGSDGALRVYNIDLTTL
ncbi:elongator complex protein 2 [Biomphalaria glabrata]|uniref:Elongator complex protein 2 n=1 Tax=Biomphalaria glabrata TaxID=6526 RepID=A0A9U8EF66_BIOGL|nr:elongator complex protein 2-like isoform X2 [Biomphalaria glabrata]KAI8755731.1 elongator complex protein 2-like [Biomphalaria glabrata]KAI8793258.1 elongator complex protein 2 [Biomphalaria glabrata]